MHATEEDPYYFAFGSNMSSQVFLRRRGMRPLEQYNAVLQDHELVFDQKGIRWLEPCFASVRKQIGSTVHGIVYRLTPQDAERLHASEGAGYQIAEIEAVAPGAGTRKCFTYITRTPCTGRRPSRRYMNKLINGAEEHGLPTEYITELRSIKTFHLPVVSNLVDLVARGMMAYLAKGNGLNIPFLKFGAGREQGSFE